MSNYRVVMRGVLPGQSLDTVAESLARLAGKGPKAMRALLASGKVVTAKRTPDMQKAVKYKKALEQIGCRSLIEAEITERRAEPAANAPSVTVDLTANADSFTPVPQEFRYANMPLRARVLSAMQVLRIKEWVSLVAMGLIVYYVWTRFVVNL